MVDAKEFESLLYIITSNTIQKIIDQTGWDEDYAMERFLKSKVYFFLEQEESKVWHYSTSMLADFFMDERSGNLVFPEV